MKLSSIPLMMCVTDVHKPQSAAILKRAFFLLIGLMMNSLVSSNAGAVEHIQVTREILLEKGNPVTPYAIAQTKDGGYVIAGALGDRIAWLPELMLPAMCYGAFRHQ